MKIVHLENQINLLDDSCPDLDNCGPMGFAPFKQDPLA